jgi:hypothetical protein
VRDVVREQRERWQGVPDGADGALHAFVAHVEHVLAGNDLLNRVKTAPAVRRRQSARAIPEETQPAGRGRIVATLMLAAYMPTTRQRRCCWTGSTACAREPSCAEATS